MHGIIAMSEQLLMQHKSQLEQNNMLEPVEIIAECADHLLALLTDLLDFSQLEHGNMKLESIPFSIPLHAEKVLNFFFLSPTLYLSVSVSVSVSVSLRNV